MPSGRVSGREGLAEALALASEILKDLESSQLPLEPIALKATRVALLGGDSVDQKIFQYELRGYPTTVSSMPPESWELACRAGRQMEFIDPQTGQSRRYVYVEPISKLEGQLSLVRSLIGSGHPTKEIFKAANMLTHVHSRSGHLPLNYCASELIDHATQRLASRRAMIHSFVSSKYHRLRFSGIADDVFDRIRTRVDTTIGTYVPDAITKFSSVHDNLRSKNPEDWSNAVHSCRRILKDLADKIYSAKNEERTLKRGGKTQPIKLGEENYINRLIAFVEEKSSSKRFKDIVGSHLAFLGDRLDSICEASHKGTHSIIIKQEEADRYVVYTYMVVGDILSLIEPSSNSK